MSKEEIAPLPPLASLIRRTARAGIYRERTGQQPAHISTLEAACCECVSACESLQRLVPMLPLTSPFAKNVHDLIMTVGTIETALHQFVDRELLEEMPGKKREAGGRLQDAVERAHGSLKPTVKASLLAGGIASVLHLFSLTLAQLNVQLRAMGQQLEAEPRHGQYSRALACGSLGLALLARAAPPSSRFAASPASRRRLALVGAAACARLLLLKGLEVRRAAALHTSLERLLSTLRLWIMSTSVLQRAHKYVAQSYVELEQLDASSLSSLPASGSGHSLVQNLGSSVGGASRLPFSRSYPQLIAMPGLHDVEEERMQPIRILYEHCVPCASTAWWWHLDPVLAATARGIDVYYAAMLTALDAAGALRGLMPRAATYVLGGCLLPWFMLHPAAAASKAYGMWCAPDMYAMQTLYAPMRWPACKAAMRLCCGQDIEHTEQSVAGVRVLMLRRKDAPLPARTVTCGAHEAEQAPPEVPTVPTVLFVPGGAFIADFEAVDLFFLYQWVRATGATLLYISYDYAPQAPYPTAQLQVLQVYLALRQHTHTLGFRASPLVLAGLSAGGNLATSALLAPLLAERAHPTAQPLLPTKEAFQMPDGLLLLCPVINFSRSPSPSRMAFASDYLLPQPMLRAFGAAYDEGAEHWLERDPLLSPVFAPDEALQKLPETCLQVGGLDPLLDDSVDFNTRIRRMGVNGDMYIYRSLPHTFVSFPHWHAMPEVQQAMAHSIGFLRRVLLKGS